MPCMASGGNTDIVLVCSFFFPICYEAVRFDIRAGECGDDASSVKRAPRGMDMAISSKLSAFFWTAIMEASRNRARLDHTIALFSGIYGGVVSFSSATLSC